jgi:radical SAM protein with 4Fe4S-binding SPASM domain
MCFSLKPEYQLRRAERSIVLFKLDELGYLGEQRLVHPNIAILLALLNGQRTWVEVKKTANFIFNLSEPKFDSVLEKFLDEWKPYLYEVTPQNKGRVKQYDPRNFVMDAKEVDLSHYRLCAPINLGYIVADRCSRKCIYCYGEQEFAPKRGLLPFERIKEIIEEASKLEVANFSFSGEPFIRKDIVDIVGEIISKGMIPLLSTKEYLSEDTVEKLNDIGLKRIQLSIDSSVPEIADFLTRSEGYFSEMTKLIDRLQKNDIEVTTNTVVTSYNAYIIPHLVKWLLEKNIRTIRISQYGRSLYRHTDDLFLSKEQVNWIKPHIIEIAQKFPEARISFATYFVENTDSETRLNKFLNRPRCTAGKSGFIINPDGTVIVCEQLPSTQEFIVGDLAQQSIMEVWNSPRLKNFLYPSKESFQGTDCYTCEHYDQCVLTMGKCIRDTLKAYGTIYAVDPNCPTASASVRLF